ncbi:MAG: DUF3363 domain-containing protein [Brevundimonas sp.]|nr:MAG: DUF3363 domain-containing protein [Brevundimonas sp.]
MLIREAIEGRMPGGEVTDPRVLNLRLPQSLKSDRIPVRNGLMKRLASSRTFALGDRAGVLRAAQNRSGRAFRLDVRQRVIVKALVCRHSGKGPARTGALAKHVAYLGRAGAGLDGAKPGYFNEKVETFEPVEETRGWSKDRHHFRFIISPEHGDRIADLRGFTREVMSRVGADLGEPELRWVGVCHFDTDQPHAHVIVRGKRGNGKDLVIPRDYISYGFRARAQEVAQERLGDLSRIDAERRVWRETEADRFTGFDRRLLAAMEADGTVADGVGGHDAWSALTRGRLRHLEELGLAVKSGSRFRLDPEMETKLRTLQARGDIIRTLNQRRLEGGREVRVFGAAAVRGSVVKTGHHDEVGASPWLVVRDRDGVEHYARLRAGSPLPARDAVVILTPQQNGLALVSKGRGSELGL